MNAYDNNVILFTQFVGLLHEFQLMGIQWLLFLIMVHHFTALARWPHTRAWSASNHHQAEVFLFAKAEALVGNPTVLHVKVW